MFDTAAAYGGGASERIVGEWLRDRRPEAPCRVIATKLLPPYEPETLIQNVRTSPPLIIPVDNLRGADNSVYAARIQWATPNDGWKETGF